VPGQRSCTVHAGFRRIALLAAPHAEAYTSNRPDGAARLAPGSTKRAGNGSYGHLMAASQGTE
jgi:hypothetical protein